MTLRLVRAANTAELDVRPLEEAPQVAVHEADLLRLREAARAEGFARGVAEAAVVLRAARAEREGVLTAAEEELASLALGLARRIVGRELTVAPETLAQMVCHAIGTLRGRHHLLLRVHPASLDVLVDRRARIEAAAGGAVVFVADPTRPKNAVSIDTEAGTLDCDLESQLSALARAMKVPLPRQEP